MCITTLYTESLFLSSLEDLPTQSEKGQSTGTSTHTQYSNTQKVFMMS